MVCVDVTGIPLTKLGEDAVRITVIHYGSDIQCIIIIKKPDLSPEF
ncbi:MAG: hypothetical protein BWY89_01512 [Bacteroidetes bacterium ADurb.BinA012]|nr:MAG: hypothetical protein BWY89_01512 [Bacteroidetes bacterium ADurb.BinA012]